MSPRATAAAFTIEGDKWVTMNGSHRNHFAHQSSMDVWLGMSKIAARGLGPVDAPVIITATVRRTTNAKADAHNVTPTIKACIDGAVKAGVIEDDHDGIVRELVIKAGPKASKPTIELRIEAC